MTQQTEQFFYLLPSLVKVDFDGLWTFVIHSGLIWLD